MKHLGKVMCVCLTMLVLLSACNSEQPASVTNNQTDGSPHESTNENASSNYVDTPSIGEPVEVVYIDPFSSDRAWVSYTQKGEKNRFLGCIDKKGNLLFSFEEKIIKEYVPFECGVSYIMLEPDNPYDEEAHGEVYIINDSGEIITTSSESQFEGVAAYGDGYFLTYGNKDDFYSDEYIFKIIDKSGEVVKEISSKLYDAIPWEEFRTQMQLLSDRRNEVMYCGEGIYWFRASREITYDTTFMFYNHNTDTFFNEKFRYMYAPEKIENGLGLGRVGPQMEPAILDVNSGEIIEVIKDQYTSNSNSVSVNDSIGPISNEKIVISYFNNYKKEDPLLYFRYWDKLGIHKIEKYAEYMSKDVSRPGGLRFDETEDRLLLPLIGKDGNRYVSVIDSNNNTIFEPLKCIDSAYYLSCGRFWVEVDGDIQICDINGNVVFSLSDIGGKYIGDYSDNVAIIDRNKNSAKAVDINGNVLFETINTTANHFVALPLKSNA